MVAGSARSHYFSTKLRRGACSSPFSAFSLQQHPFEFPPGVASNPPDVGTSSPAAPPADRVTIRPWSGHKNTFTTVCFMNVTPLSTQVQPPKQSKLYIYIYTHIYIYSYIYIYRKDLKVLLISSSGTFVSKQMCLWIGSLDCGTPLRKA